MKIKVEERSKMHSTKWPILAVERVAGLLKASIIDNKLTVIPLNKLERFLIILKN